MAWRDDLRKVTMSDGRVLIGASFRGIPYFVESVERSGGRRTVTHEFPLRDNPTIDDLGRKARPFRDEGYVLGDDYLSQRDALLSALEDVAGPGELVHPYYGVRRVICESATVRESIAEGGTARFDIVYIEAPALTVAPAQAPDLDADVAMAADAADAALLLELESSYSVDDEPAFALESLSSDLTALAVDLGARLAAEVRDEQELARLDAALNSLVGQASSLIRDPGEAVTELRALLENIASAVAGAPDRIFAALMATYNAVEVVLVEGDTATRELERANQAALGAALRQTLLIAAALVLLDVEHASVDEAIADRAELVEALDEQALTAGTDAYPALMLLRATVLLAVPGNAALARVVTVTRNTSLPALLLAYQLYGAIDLEQDIIDRNASQHPGFLVGDLKVLSNA